MRKSHLYGHILVALLFISSLSARQPAVEPVIGLSIDDQKPIPPSKAKGYKFRPNFKRSERKIATHKNLSNDINDINDIREVKPETNSGTIPVVFILFLTLLPIAIWFIIIRGAKQSSSVDKQKLPDNVTILEDYKADNSSDDSGNNGIPKAS